jgi:hypothetical protein
MILLIEIIIHHINECFDSRENILVCDINEQDDDDESNPASADIPPKIKEAIEIMQKIRLLATTTIT